MIQGVERGDLLGLGPLQDETDDGVAEIGGQMDLGDGDGADAGIGQLVPDQLFQFFANAFRDALGTVRIQTSG